jgi:hypothetical protein
MFMFPPHKITGQRFIHTTAKSTLRLHHIPDARREFTGFLWLNSRK